MVGGWEAEAYYFLGHHTSVNDTDDETTGRRGDGGICAKFATGRSLRVRRESRDATTRLTVYSVNTNPKTRLLHASERAGSGGPSKVLYGLTIVYPGAAVL